MKVEVAKRDYGSMNEQELDFTLGGELMEAARAEWLGTQKRWRR